MDKNYERPYWLYILRLRDGKYYVGITNRKDPHSRIREHGKWLGARWTYKHKPLEVLEIRNLGPITKQQAEIAEQQATLELMNMHGYRNVRGGQLVYSGDYTKFLHRYFRDYDWKNFVSTAVTIGFLLAVILFLVLRDRPDY